MRASTSRWRREPEPAEVDRRVLHEAGAFAGPDKRRKRLELLIAEAARKGWKRGAVWHKYLALFGCKMSGAEWAYVVERRPEG